jgi:AraC-like DNA-binding protein
VTVQPTLCAPGQARGTDRPVAGALLWQVDQLADGVHRILPDLSRDMLWDGPLPVVLPPTTVRLLLPAVRGTRTVGVRLPIGATGVRIAPTWPGWLLDDPNDPEERLDRLARAVAEKALTWVVPEDRDRIVRDLDLPGTRMPSVAARHFRSERSLRRTSTAWFGLPPGKMAQVLRLWRFAGALRQVRVARAATEAGYTDQSHAHREVRALTGLTPGQLASWTENSFWTGGDNAFRTIRG